MSTAEKPPKLTPPDHTQPPDSGGTFVKHFQEHPQSILLTDSIRPVLERHHPEGRYAMGQDCGIYCRMTDPPERASREAERAEFAERAAAREAERAERLLAQLRALGIEPEA